jgi:2-polyprenyl-6-methoxyphenol hydroxylase-like FAD-dependent oxidoreductase
VTTIERDCVIAGGGPAGMVLGHLLARAGLRVTVLEKHADFLRDFRGDTIHPSTLTVLGELGLREKFLELPVHRLRGMDIVVDGDRMSLVDFGTLPSPDDFLVFAPQWDFLDFLARESAALPGFELRMSTEATGLVIEDGVVRGILASCAESEVELRATLVVAADGRGSRLRDAAGLIPVASGVPIDVLWFDLPKPADPPPPTLGYLDARGMVLTIDRGDRFQGGLVIRKGGFDELSDAGLDTLRERIVAIAPVLAPVAGALVDWRQVKLLSVQLDHLERWSRPGFVAIGDAAHAMSPVGGVGVNYAIQDAVALANAISGELALGTVRPATIDRVQRRRMRPVRLMQRIQKVVHDRIAGAAPRGRALPAPARALLRLAGPLVRRIAARVIGRGFRPEHVRSELRRPSA